MRTHTRRILALSLASGACVFNPDASGNPGSSGGTATPDCNPPVDGTPVIPGGYFQRTFVGDRCSTPNATCRAAAYCNSSHTPAGWTCRCPDTTLAYWTCTIGSAGTCPKLDAGSD